jgi:hypothetical protein
MPWVRVGEIRGAYLRERERLVDPGLDGRIILKWIFRKLDGGSWTVDVA